MPAGKAGPRPKTPEELEAIKKQKEEKAAAAQAAKEAKAKEKAEAKAKKEQEAAEAKAKKQADKDAKKAAKEAAKAGIGHNSSLTEEEQRALLVNGVGEIIELQDKLATINASIRNVRKKLKANGYDNVEVNFAIKLRRSEDHEADQTEWRKMIRAALFMAHPIGTQPDLFYQAGDGVDRTPSVDKAYEEGKMVGMEGKQRCEPPSHYGNEQQQKWIEGWHAGQALLMRGGLSSLSPIIKKADEPAPDEGGDDDFMPPTPDHAKDPTSPAHPNNLLN